MRIALFWNHKLIGEALTTLLSRIGRLDVVGQSSEALECLKMVRDSHANVVLVEEKHLTADTTAYLEGAQLVQGFGLVVLTEDHIEGMEETSGNWTKLSLHCSGEDLFNALKKVAPGSYPTRRPRVRKSSQLGLSARESEVVELVAKGLSNRKIAEMTSLQEQSVKNMVSTIMRRLNCENRTQLALLLTKTQVSQPQA